MRYQDADGFPGDQRAGRGYQDQFDPPADPYGGVRGTGGFTSLGAQARMSEVFQAVPGQWSPATSDYPTQDEGLTAAGRPADDGSWYEGLDSVSGGGRRSRGLLAGGTAGLLAAALAIGVANLAAAFIRPQASPIIAVGGAFIDRTPPALKNFAVAKFGENDKNMLLLGMYVTIALLAVLIGMIAWRHISVGVAGIGLFGAFGAFVAYTRPESRVSDVIPSAIGGVAGIIALALLARWAARRAPAYHPAYDGPRHRTSGAGWAA